MKAFQPTAPNHWDERKAMHLLNRAGFGGPPDEAADLVKLGFEKSVERFLDYEKIPDDFPAPDWAENPPDDFLKPDTVRRQFRNVPEAERREKFQEYQRQIVGADPGRTGFLTRACRSISSFRG